jgi:uncharacterized protein YcgI (DUF1989 family)
MMTHYDPTKSDGQNRSASLGVSIDGTPELGKRFQIPPRCGMAVRVLAGQSLIIENTHGNQVCDFWAFAEGNLQECVSMEHLHTALGSIFPKEGDGLFTNCRRKLMTIVEDTSPGVHDTVISACDIYRYQQFGCSGYHDNCSDNLRMAMNAIGLQAPKIPAPFNIWMNIPVAEDGSVQFLPTVSKPGDRIVLRAEIDSIAAMSACPMDVTPINGEGCQPTELHFSVIA